MKLEVREKIKVILENSQERNILLEYIQRDCILENPTYYSTIKQGRSTRGLEKEYFFYKEISNLEFELPRGLEFNLTKFLNERGIVYSIKRNYLKNTPIEGESKIKELREYQKELEKELERKDHGFILVPTGGGKTVVMINEIIKNKQSTFLLIHNKKLLYQFIDRLKQFTNISEDDIGIYGDSKREIKPITVALMQSFGKLSEREIRDITSKFDLFFIDETHHLVANTLLKIGTNVASKRFYGLTATPYKSEGLAIKFLEKIIGPLVYQITEEELQSHGVILKPHFYPIPHLNSNIKNIYNDLFKLEDWKVHKYYVEQFQDVTFTRDFLSNEENESTLVVGETTQEIYSFYDRLPEEIKKVSKLIPSSIFKKNQSVLQKHKLVVSLDTPQQYRRIDFHKIKKGLYYLPSRISLVHQCILHEFKNNKNKNPNILVLSDEVNHLITMYESLPEELKKHSTLLYGGIKKKERDKIEEDIENKKYRVIFATDKYVGEGWDQSHLDVLILTGLMKDHEGLKQLVGRVIRSHPNKNHASVYDIVDLHCPITFSQFKKRYENYYKIQATTNAKIDLLNRTITYE